MIILLGVLYGFCCQPLSDLPRSLKLVLSLITVVKHEPDDQNQERKHERSRVFQKRSPNIDDFSTLNASLSASRQMAHENAHRECPVSYDAVLPRGNERAETGTVSA